MRTGKLTPVARRLLWVTIVKSVALGIPVTTSVIYVTQIAGLDVRHVGLTLTATAAVAVGLGTWIGHLADRFGARGLYAGLLALEALAIGALAWTGDLAQFVAVALALAVSDLGQRSAQGAVIAESLPPPVRVHTRAVLRVAANAGLAAGAALGGGVLYFDDAAIYAVALVSAGAGLAVAAAIALRLPRADRPAGGAGHGPWAVLSDRPFVGFMLLNGILNVHNPMLKVAMPLWVAVGTDAPRWLVAALTLVNLASVVGLQIRLSRGTEYLAGASVAGRRAGVGLAVACLLLAVSGATEGWATVAILLVAAAAHALGEIWESASAWGVSFAVAPPEMAGQYQGAHAMGRGLGDLIGPALLTSVAVTGGGAGWMVVGALFAAAGLLTPVLVARMTAVEEPAVTRPDAARSARP